MNALTAARTFARPGLCPAKAVRIFNDRWYAVRFQNVETDPRCDYVGLADGEYTELLPGIEARRARDSRLNHCNDIAEWTGPVFRVDLSAFGRPLGSGPRWYVSPAGADKAVEAHLARRAEHIAAGLKEADRHFTQTIESLKASARRSGIGIACLDDPNHWEEELVTRNRWGQQSQAAADKERDNPSWAGTVTQIRA